MKNKKLFAILTLVCFMFTLMPVAAFAEDGPGPVTVTTENDLKTNLEAGKSVVLGNAIELTEYIKVSGTVTLDLSEYEITSAFSNNYGTIYVSKTGNLTVTGNGKITAENTYAIGNYGTVTIEDGTFTGGENYAALYNFYYDNITYGKSTIKDGTLNAVWNCGELTINGGNLEYVDNTAKLIANGGTIDTLLVKIADYDLEIEAGTTVAEECNVTNLTYTDDVVATINGAPYATLEEAIEAATASQTVVLQKDIELTEKISVTKEIILDLNENEISSDITDSYGLIYVSTQGNLTVTGNGKIVSENACTIGNYGTVTIENGTFTAGEDYAALYNFYYNGSTYGKSTIKGGTLNVVWNCGDLSVEGGNVALIDNSGNAAISGAESVIGDVIAQDGGDAAAVEGAGTLNITGGTFTGAFTAEDDDAAIISGGIFEANNVANYLADGYVLIQNADGTYSPETKTSTEGITLAKNYTTIRVGNSETLTIDSMISGATVTWTSSDESVATVATNGKVTAAKTGETIITAAITVEGTTYTDTCTVTVYTASTGGGGFTGSYNYPANVDVSEDCDVELSDSYATEGETVTITVTPDAGKQVESVIVTDKDGEVIPVTKVGTNKYEFVMPEGEVNIVVLTEEASYENTIVLQIGNYNVVADGTAFRSDVAPFIVNDRTYVPIRVIIEALGGEADWDEATRTVTLYIDGKVLTMVIDQIIPAYGCAAIIVDDRTYVPVRYVTEAVGFDVDWDADTRQIFVRK